MYVTAFLIDLEYSRVDLSVQLSAFTCVSVRVWVRVSTCLRVCERVCERICVYMGVSMSVCRTGMVQFSMTGRQSPTRII